MSFVNEPLSPPEANSPAPAAPPAPRRRGWPLIAWLVIAGVVAFILVRAALRPRDPAAYLVPMQMQARYLVGVNALGVPGMSGSQLWEQSRAALERGPYGQRMRAAILAGELVGPAEAAEALQRLEEARAAGTVTPSSDEAVEIAGLLGRLYAGYQLDEAAPWGWVGWPAVEEPGWVAGHRLSAEGQARLRDRLGWFGDLAVAAPQGDRELRQQVVGSARVSVILMLVIVFLGLFAFLAGLVTGVILLVLALIGRLGSGVSSVPGNGGIYAETFALYLVTFIALSWALRYIPVEGGAGMMLGGVAMVGSLVVLAWPPLRGVPWRQVREDIGLTFGPQPWKEIFAGVGSYLCALPLLLLGVGVTLVLTLVQKQVTGRDPTELGEGPSHPVGGVALMRDPWAWVAVILLAVVLAPIVEEIMFRGLLYRHLREATGRWATFLSIAAATIASGFVFAIIHPQGLLGVPVLMALATSFALAREWRGSLVGPMIAHGINNGVATLFLFVMAG